MRHRSPDCFRCLTAVSLALLVVLGNAASGQARPSPGPRQRVVQALRQAAARDTVDPRAADALRLFIRTGLTTPYIASETTRLFGARSRISEQIVKHLGPARSRIEYQSPPSVSGEIVIVTGRRMFRYSPRLGKILEGPLLGQEDVDQRLRGLLGSVRRGDVTIAYMGTETVAKRTGTIVEIRATRGVARTKRLWIDDKTGIRLKIEDRNARGAIVSSSEYTHIELTPALAPRDFSPDSLPNVPHEAMVPNTAPLATLDAAQSLVRYQIHQPALPAGFHFDAAWVVSRTSARATTILRYTDGVSTVALYQHPVPLPGILDKAAAMLPAPKLRRGGMMWIAGDRLYYVVGYLKADAVERLVGSLK